MATIYTAHVTSTGGRDGRAESDDKNLSLQLSRPGTKSGTNPEQLFAAGYSACFLSAVAHISKERGANAEGLTVKADVDLNKEESTGFSLGVVLNVSLPNMDKSAAEDVVKAAHQMCPYSKATRGNVDVKLNVNGQMLAKAA